MNSKQDLRYIKRRIGDDLKNQILVRNGIITENEMEFRHIVFQDLEKFEDFLNIQWAINGNNIGWINHASVGVIH